MPRARKHKRLTARRFRGLIDAISNRLAEYPAFEDREAITFAINQAEGDFAEHEEDAAFETLVSNLHEVDFPLTQDIMDRVAQFGETLGIVPDRWALLSSLFIAQQGRQTTPRKRNPIHVLLNSFFPSLEKIAPEKSGELRQILATHSVTFQIVETEQPLLLTLVDNGHKIIAGVGSLGRLWAMAYGYFCLYTVVADAAKGDVHTIRYVDLKKERRISQASALLEWAVSVEVGIAEEIRNGAKAVPDFVEWPSDLPHPLASPPRASDGQVANELFLCTGAFLLHRELAHIYLKHPSRIGQDAALDLDQDADMASAQWILGGLTADDDRFVKRGLGMSLGLSWTLSIAIHETGSESLRAALCQRLLIVLGHFVTDPNHVIWAFISTILRANVESAKIEFDRTREVPSFREDVEWLVNCITQHEKA